MAGAPDLVAWSVDPHDVITAVGGDWDEFAQVNEAPWLTAQSVVGRPLLSFVDGEAPRLAYARLLQAARTSGKVLRIPFRCDAPGMRRWMELAIVPFDDATVQFRSALLRSEKRPPVRLLDPLEPRSQLDASVCSICLGVRTIDGWLDAADAERRLQIGVASRPPRLRYVLCPDCAARLGDLADKSGAEH